MKAEQIFEDITRQLVELIEDGANGEQWQVPWAKMAAVGMPVNATTRRGYTGGNAVALWIYGMVRGYTTAEWMTYKQAEGIGAQVRKGEKGVHLIKWLMLPCRKHGGECECKPVMMPKGFVVFNAAQVDGYEPKVADETPLPGAENQRLAMVEAFFAETGAVVQEGGNKAYYNRVLDMIGMPTFEQFEDPEAYYATLGHEHIHWTGHKNRLDRVFGKRFGDNEYAAEELVAEIGAAFLCATLGITPIVREDHAQYLAHWLGVIKAEPKALFEAAGKAQKAVEFLVELTAEVDLDVTTAA